MLLSRFHSSLLCFNFVGFLCLLCLTLVLYICVAHSLYVLTTVLLEAMGEGGTVRPSTRMDIERNHKLCLKQGSIKEGVGREGFAPKWKKYSSPLDVKGHFRSLWEGCFFCLSAISKRILVNTNLKNEMHISYRRTAASTRHQFFFSKNEGPLLKL